MAKITKNIYIISDLHLSSKRPHTVCLFERFLNEVINENSTLYILGDFFDYWIGDDYVDAFIQHIINLLRATAKKGITIYFMHGNRDFLIGKTFAKKAQLTLIDDPYMLKINDLQILLMHGDLLCTSDVKYQRFRRVARNKWTKTLYLSLPLGIRRSLAKGIRKKSSAHNRKQQVIDVTRQGIDTYAKDVAQLIHGHTHLFNTHLEESPQRHVLGDWDQCGSYIVIDRKEIKLMPFK